ncbi:Beta-barrel assembly machine subunit BamC [Pseudomonas duriflava]|uniref:Beta-barrel assembly machine subunit BamC n=1 Tax=Pseudomonas duriflava TaxID=459528 RepID=A0A562QPE7_9PSED|nr:outer membrane protein assembly factor BamC [Pseudomonas duriflava]TWI58619.1 Beta-barrel assembly machine subunit BamC [Pseudomonas duriflava]
MKRLVEMSALAVIIGTTSGCGWLWGEHGYFRDRGNDYLDARQTAPMQVPSDVQAKPLDPLLPLPANVPDVQARSSSFEVPRPQSLPIQADTGDYSLQRSGSSRWALAQRQPAEVWPVAHQFFTDNGFIIAEERPQTGEFVTQWQPLTDLTTPLARSLSSSSGLEPGSETRIRVRIEPGVSSNTSEIFVQNQTRRVGSTSEPEWSSRSKTSPFDAALLNEMVTSLASADTQGGSVSLLAAGSYDTPERVAYSQDGNGNPMLTLSSDFDRAWSSIGRAIEGANIRVDDLDRSLGVYYINLAEGALKPDQSKPGFFGRLFGSQPSTEEQEARAERYQVRLTRVDDVVQVTLDKNINTVAPADVAETVLKKLQTSMQYALRSPGQREPGEFNPGSQP